MKKKNLDQAVKDNKLTADQRDAILACDKAPLTCDRSNLPAFGFGGGFGHHGGPGGPGFGPGKRGPGAAADTYAKDLAAELGISEDKVVAALKAQRPKFDDHGPGGRGHHGGPGPGFGPPPGAMNGSAPVQPEVPQTSA